MSQFTKYNNPNRKKVNRKISRSDADIIAAKNMIDDLNSGIELPLSYYDQQSDELCGMPSRNIYQASEPKTTVKNILVDFIEDIEESETKIVKKKKIEVKPMSEEEAIIQMNMLGHSFFVYKDVDTNEICVLYKRQDGNYGVIETK